MMKNQSILYFDFHQHVLLKLLYFCLCLRKTMSIKKVMCFVVLPVPLNPSSLSKKHSFINE